ncbi:uncharacterized protein LOC121690302 [Alosa sapidissima]|uniref:uncharacterized protein LOC121690302 n=1 Tax=Alosa sapidissima TaxID=34773 RepID=UPI001C085A38|nr:uncharacterized protein LOC121690302 [Alosa sapidissima]
MWQKAIVMVVILGFTSQTEDIEFKSDLPHLLLQDNNSNSSFINKDRDYVEDGAFEEKSDLLKDIASPTSFVTKDDAYIKDIESEYMLVSPNIHSDLTSALLPPHKEAQAKKENETPKEWPVKRFRRENVVDEGSGMSENETVVDEGSGIGNEGSGISENETTSGTTQSTSTGATTTTTTISTATTRPAPVIQLQAVILIVFTAALEDTQSQEFRQQATVVERAFDVIYSEKYGILFVRTIVIAFRRSTRNRMDEVETDIELVFNEDSTEPLPQSSDVVNTLVTAMTSPNSGFNLTVLADSIRVTSAPRLMSIPQFRTNETFTDDLSNSLSNAFRNRSSLIKRELEPFFLEDIQDFISLTPTSFRNGSIIHSTNLTVTANGTFPNDLQIIGTLTRAALSGNVSFTIISINGIALSAGEVSSSINLMSVCGLTILSLLAAKPW